MGVQRLSLGDLLLRDETEEGDEHAVEEEGARMELHQFHQRRENEVDVLCSRWIRRPTTRQRTNK